MPHSYFQRPLELGIPPQRSSGRSLPVRAPPARPEAPCGPAAWAAPDLTAMRGSDAEQWPRPQRRSGRAVPADLLAGSSARVLLTPRTSGAAGGDRGLGSEAVEPERRQRRRDVWGQAGASRLGGGKRNEVGPAEPAFRHPAGGGGLASSRTSICSEPGRGFGIRSLTPCVSSYSLFKYKMGWPFLQGSWRIK